MWPIRVMASLCDVTSSKRVYAKDLCAAGVPFLRSTEIIEKLNGQEAHSNPLFISEEHFQEIFRTVGAPLKDDLLLTSRGTLGVPYIVKATDRFHFADGNLTWFRRFKDLNSRFLKYFLLSPRGKAELSKCVIGSAQSAYTISALKNIAVPLPPPAMQDRIASILSAYDDLIENNTRRIKILEDMAQMLYREWFVNFRFPGHEKVRMVESELGPIPEGWSAPTLEEVLEYNIGGGWGEEQASDEFCIPAYVIRGTDIPGARHGSVGNCPLRWHKESNFRSRKLQADDLVFEVSGGSKGQPVGRSLVVRETLLSQFDRDVICASFCKLLRPKTGMSAALYCFLIEAYTNGSIEKYQVQSTGISNFKFTAFVNEVRMPLPPTSVMARFKEVVMPMQDAVAVFGKRNANLRTTRDFLLPKLISGEVPVEAAAEPMEQTA